MRGIIGAMKTSRRKQSLVDHLDSVFYGNAWHGAALFPTIQKFALAPAAIENEEGFSAWKITLHCAYWKFDVRRRLIRGGPRPSFGRKPRDFPHLPVEISEETWKADKSYLEEEHRLLRRAVLALPDKLLDERPPRGSFTYEGYILGAAGHDIYHTAHVRNLGVIAF